LKITVSVQGWKAIELLLRLVCAQAGRNRHQATFCKAVQEEDTAMRRLGLHEYLIVGSEYQRRLVLELIYQLSKRVLALQNVQSFFAVTAFTDVPGSRLHKSDLLAKVTEHNLQRDISGGILKLVEDVPSFLIQGQSIAGVSMEISGAYNKTMALLEPSGPTSLATDRMRSADGLKDILDRLDAIPATVTSTPIKALAGLCVDRIKDYAELLGNDATVERRCAEVMEAAGWKWSQNVPNATASNQQLKAGVLRATRLAVQSFPDPQEEELQLRHSNINDPGNIRPHYGAFIEPRTVALQERALQCEALLITLLDLQNNVSMLEDNRRQLKENAREQAEAKLRLGQLARIVQADAAVVADFEAMKAAQAARISRIPRSIMQGKASSSTQEYVDGANEHADFMLAQTREALARHETERMGASNHFAKLQKDATQLTKEISFYEYQLDLMVAHLKDSGLVNQRGSEVFDMRCEVQKQVVDNAIFHALGSIIDAVARLKLVNRGYGDEPKYDMLAC